MKNEDSLLFERLIVKMLALVVTTVILTIGSCCIHSDYRIAKAIEQGNDPVIARLAFSDGYTERILHIANKEK
jgi:hypothetical protein